VLIDRSHVVQALRSGGRAEEARRAEEELDVHVDTVRDADLLRELGIDPDSRAQGGGLALRGGPGGATTERSGSGPAGRVLVGARG
jgi:hypothetical protein